MNTMTDINENKTVMLKYIKPLLISAATVIVTAPIAWYIPKYLEKKQIEINLQELNLSGGRYVYLIDIKNVGKSFIQDVDLFVLVNGQVHSSMFEGGPTTHDPYYRLDKSPFNGKIEINDEDTVRTVSYPFKADSMRAENSNKLLKNSIRNIIESKSSIWYQLNITPVNLAKNKTLHASVITDSKIDNNQIKCKPNPELCTVRKIENIPNEKFERILSAMSVQQGSVSNKIFGTGIGVSKIMVRGSAIAEAKQKAIRDFYRDIAQKLYGIDVKSMVKQYTETNSDETTSNIYSSTVTLGSKGVIDRASAVIYHENSSKLKSGEIVYEVKGYYELPQEIGISDKHLNIGADFAFPLVPIELEGNVPDWIENHLLEDENILMSSIGTSDKDLPFPLAKRIAANRALTQLSQMIRVNVQQMVKQYLGDANVENKQELQENISVSVTKKISDNKLVGSRIIAYYRQDDGVVHALAIIPQYIIESNALEDVKKATGDQGLGNVIEKSLNHDKSLWEQFKARKRQDELAEEISKMESEINQKDMTNE